MFPKPLSGKPLGMPCHVVADEGRDEVIGMIVAGLHPQRQRHICRLARRREQFRAQLFGQKIVGASLVDQDIPVPATAPDQGTGIMRQP